MRVLHTLLESRPQPDQPPPTTCLEREWADALGPGVPALAELLVVDTSVPSQAKGKQAMNQPPSGQVDKAALQLDAAYLLLFVLDNQSPQVDLCMTLPAQMRARAPALTQVRIAVYWLKGG